MDIRCVGSCLKRDCALVFLLIPPNDYAVREGTHEGAIRKRVVIHCFLCPVLGANQ